MSGIDDGRAARRLIGLEVAVQRLDDGTCAQVAASDAADHHHVALVAEGAGRLLDVGEEVGLNAAGEVQPADEIITGTRTLFEGTQASFYLRLQRLDGFLGNKVKDFLV